ncbi:hypothetical protein [Mesobacillus zeae]|uniref:Lipoprotein n=1 Tax=Mesobacillus zeae TaxID=1917180 RepID=A0A398BIC0_9BACI|nr:hypothetical protein [Mesobacillus zeae]RID87470.1 hypothetical protein D1970_04655 [Mesobacillus zeae]
MKKFWLLAMALTFAIGLTACSGGKKEESSSESKKETEKAPESSAKSTLYKFYMDMSKTINDADADLNAYENAAPEEQTPEMKTKASESAANVSKALDQVEVPGELKDQKADLEAAIKDFSASYKAKAEELKKDEPSLDAANATFTTGEEKLGKAFESVKMKKPSLVKEVG